jgi:TetR/AcrR family transcriptional regulator
MRRRPRPSPGTRPRILSAAADEFGARGFAATSVDSIARRARVNKAMIYYHFPSKRALYAAIVREHFTPIMEKLAAITAEPAPPAEQLDHLIASFVDSIGSSTSILPIFLREIADGAAHLGPKELALLAGIFGAVRSVIAEGTRQDVFQPIHPSLAHFTIIAPAIMFLATAPIRTRIDAIGAVAIPDADPPTLVTHLQMVARRMLAPR